MAKWREQAIRLGMGLFSATGAYRLAEPFTRGVGAILMFHRVRAQLPGAFNPNGGLEITPAFLDALLTHLRVRGFDILSLDEALLRLDAPERPFVALTFDDGYRDLVDEALPVLERHKAPFTAYITSGFAAGTARLWWLEMEEAIRRLDYVDIVANGRQIIRRCGTEDEKSEAFADVYRAVRGAGESELRRVVDALCVAAGLEPTAITRDACLAWEELTPLVDHPLATIGAHSVTHARLAKLSLAEMQAEMAQSRSAVKAAFGVDTRHFCYPVGDVTSADRREFEAARALGFISAVTTRPGVLFPEHRSRLFALPRVSVNGRHQSLAAMDVLLSGAPFALMNRGNASPPDTEQDHFIRSF